jgi:hypothetical protein
MNGAIIKHERTMQETLDALAAPVPSACVKTLKDKDNAQYVHWYDVCALADERAPGWCHSIKDVGSLTALRGAKEARKEMELAYVVVRIWIDCSDGCVEREAIGIDDDPMGQYGTPLERAEGAGFRRAFAKFGLGLELYKGPAQAMRQAAAKVRSRPRETAVEVVVGKAVLDAAVAESDGTRWQHVPADQVGQTIQEIAAAEGVDLDRPIEPLAAEEPEIDASYAKRVYALIDGNMPEGLEPLAQEIDGIGDPYHRTGARRYWSMAALLLGMKMARSKVREAKALVEGLPAKTRGRDEALAEAARLLGVS